MTGELVAGRYRMKRRLGAGGMATVFLAEDTRLEREVAIKRLHADSPEDVGRRFQREAKVGASLNHPNIVGVFDTVTDDEGVLIVMEYVAGHTLRDEIGRGPIEPGRAIEILSAVSSALDHAHEAGVVHRDVKPANVLIDDGSGSVKLADLGIATAAERTRITHSGNVLGTAAYMAPERLDGGAGGPAVDVYALAAVAFEMLSGRKAVEGSTPLEIARRVTEAPPADLRDAVPGAPEAAAVALKRALSKDPSMRQGTAGEVVRDLASAYAEQAQASRRPRVVAPAAAAQPAPLASPPPPASPAPTTAPRVDHGRRRVPVFAIAAAALLAIAIAAIVLASSGGSGSDNKTASKPAAPAHKNKPSKQPQASSTPQPSAQPQQPTAPVTPPSAPPQGGSTPSTSVAAPTDAVSAFYTTAAQRDYKASWALGTDRLHSQLGSYDSYVSQERTLRSIEFPKLTVVSQNGNTASVAFRSVAHHTNRTDRCTGTISVAKAGSGWLVDHLDSVSCTHGPA